MADHRVQGFKVSTLWSLPKFFFSSGVDEVGFLFLPPKEVLMTAAGQVPGGVQALRS